MSDQADNLRQLVRAQRVWRELTLQDSPTPVVRPSAPWDTLHSAEKDRREDQTGERFRGVLKFVGRVIAWVFDRRTR
jgi:hypothetical protein